MAATATAVNSRQSAIKTKTGYLRDGQAPFSPTTLARLLVRLKTRGALCRLGR